MSDTTPVVRSEAVVPVPPEPEPQAPAADPDADWRAYRATRVTEPAAVPPASPAPVLEATTEEEPAAPVIESDPDETPDHPPYSGEQLTPTQKKINKAWRQRRDAERARDAALTDAQKTREELARLKGRLEALEARPGTTPDPAAPTTPTTAKADAMPDDPADPKPDRDSFDTYEAGEEAVARWIVRQEIKASDARKQQEQRDQESLAAQQQARKAFADRVTAFKSEHDDWDTVVNQPNLPVTPAMDAFILASDHGPALVHYLGTHPDECRAIAAITSELGVVHRLARIEGTLGVASAAAPAPPAAAPPQPVSHAPAPPQMLRGNVVAEPDTDTADFGTYKKLRAAGKL